MKSSDQEPSKWKTYFRLLSYLKGLKGRFAVSILGFLIFAVSQPALAKVMEEIIDAIEKKDAEARWVLPFVAVGVFFMRGVGSFLGVYYNEFVGASVVTRVKKEVFEHLILLPASFYNETSQGLILHRLNNGVGQIQAAVTNALKILVKEGFTVICLL
ncbi:MAG: lipid ABC transporter permease/ATP-binding protein, partial [Ketobacter sp.]